MSPAHVHLALNHIPLLVPLVGLVLLAYGAWKKNSEAVRFGLIAFIIAAVAALPVYFSGEGAEEIVEHLPGVSETLIEEHEEAAAWGLAAIELLGTASLGAFIFMARTKRTPSRAISAILLLSLAAIVIVARVANLGGQIRHEEVRAGFVQPSGSMPEETE